MNDTPKTPGKSRSPCFYLFFCGMCSLLAFRCLTFAAGCCLQDQTATVTAVAGANMAVRCVHAALFKLGTGLTRSLNIGGHLGFSLPLMAGLERQCAPDWSAYGTMSSGWSIGNRDKATSAWDQPSTLVSIVGGQIAACVITTAKHNGAPLAGQPAPLRETTRPCRPLAVLFQATVLARACTATITGRRFCGAPSVDSRHTAYSVRT
jgi:hypothetical protein